MLFLLFHRITNDQVSEVQSVVNNMLPATAFLGVLILYLRRGCHSNFNHGKVLKFVLHPSTLLFLTYIVSAFSYTKPLL